MKCPQCSGDRIIDTLSEEFDLECLDCEYLFLDDFSGGSSFIPSMKNILQVTDLSVPGESKDINSHVSDPDNEGLYFEDEDGTMYY